MTPLYVTPPTTMAELAGNIGPAILQLDRLGVSVNVSGVCALIAVPLLFGPINTGFAAVPPKKVAPKGMVGKNGPRGVVSLRTLAPARTTVLPFPRRPKPRQTVAKTPL